MTTQKVQVRALRALAVGTVLLVFTLLPRNASAQCAISYYDAWGDEVSVIASNVLMDFYDGNDPYGECYPGTPEFTHYYHVCLTITSPLGRTFFAENDSEAQSGGGMVVVDGELFIIEAGYYSLTTCATIYCPIAWGGVGGYIFAEQGGGGVQVSCNVEITEADITQDRVTVRLSPPGCPDAVLNVSVLRNGQPDVFIYQGIKSPGSNQEIPFLGEILAEGTYYAVVATWNNGTDARAVDFAVLGHDWRQSTYNTPDEANCSTATSTGYLVTYTGGQCTQYTPVTLRTSFMNLVGLFGQGTGSGTSINYGFLKSEHAFGQCSSHGNTPGDLDFRQEVFSTACIGTQYNYANNSTVAAPWGLIHSPNARAGCGQQYLISKSGNRTVKSVTDYCPHCGNYNVCPNCPYLGGRQFDNYTTNTACTSALGQTDYHTVIRLN